MRIITERARQAIAQAAGLRLNLGCGGKPTPGMVNIDLRPLDGVDIEADLNQPLDLIPDRSVVEVHSHHVFEHIDQLELLLAELMRVCAPDARLLIRVPHFSNPFGYSDTTHRRFFGIYSFSYFAQNEYFPQRHGLPRYRDEIRFEIERVVVRFYRNTRFDRLILARWERLLNYSTRWLEFHEYRLAWLFPLREVEFHLRRPGNSTLP